MNLRPGLFLDRDGVVNEEAGYLYRWEECHIVDGIAELVATANELGYVTCIVTNQAGIGRGYYTEADFHVLMDQISKALLDRGARIDAIYFSPFHPEHGVGDYKRATDCRKPGPGMLLRAAAEHDIDLGQSVMVGDRCTDMEAAAAAGISDMYLFGKTEIAPCLGNVPYTRTNQLNDIRESLLSKHSSLQR